MRNPNPTLKKVVHDSFILIFNALFCCGGVVFDNRIVVTVLGFTDPSTLKPSFKTCPSEVCHLRSINKSQLIEWYRPWECSEGIGEKHPTSHISVLCK